MSTIPPKILPTPASIAAGVTALYGRLQCFDCAKHLAREMKSAGFHGRIVELYGDRSNRGHICMQDDSKIPFQMEPGKHSISENGRHFGVEVQGIIYDNIFRQGIPEARWKDEFECYVPLDTTTFAKF